MFVRRTKIAMPTVPSQRCLVLLQPPLHSTKGARNKPPEDPRVLAASGVAIAVRHAVLGFVEASAEAVALQQAERRVAQPLAVGTHGLMATRVLANLDSGLEFRHPRLQDL